MMPAKPTSYSELADIATNLPMILREVRRSRGLTLRQVAQESGVLANTIFRVECGADCRLSNAILLFRWLGNDRHVQPQGIPTVVQVEDPTREEFYGEEASQELG